MDDLRPTKMYIIHHIVYPNVIMWISGKFLSKFALEAGFYWFKNPYVKTILPLIKTDRFLNIMEK
jgi:hypothetical protein